MRPRFGWLGYQNIEKAVELGPDYVSACKSMFKTTVPTAAEYREKAARLTDLPQPEKDFIEQMVDKFQLTGLNGKPLFKRVDEDASTSLTFDDHVTIKIRPRAEGIFVGVRDRDETRRVDGAQLPVALNISPSTFHGFVFDVTDVDFATDSRVTELVKAAQTLYGA